MADNSLIYKDNRIIEASYRLSIREQRLVLLAISQINALEMLNENKVITITASEYSSVFGVDQKNAFRDMKWAMDQLFNQFIKVIVSEDKTEAFRWLSKKSATLSNQSVEVRFTADIAPYLHNLKGKFTKYPFLNISGMASVFSIRLYEMLMQWKSKRTLTITVDDLKDRLEIADKYKAFANLKQKVIDTALEEINACSDIVVSYEPIKRGRKVVSVRFDYEFKKGMEPVQEIKQGIQDVIKDIRRRLK
jgi:plasmid replication initiation protein